MRPVTFAANRSISMYLSSVAVISAIFWFPEALLALITIEWIRPTAASALPVSAA